MRILVLGIGNTLLGDEGVGVASLDVLGAALAGHADRADIEFLDGGTLSFTLAVPIAECDALLVIDAAELGREAGAVASFAGDAMDGFVGSHRKRSVHEVSLIDLMAISQLGGCWPAQRALIGVQPAFVGWADTLSAPVQASLQEVSRLALATVEDWIGREIDSRQ